MCYLYNSCVFYFFILYRMVKLPLKRRLTYLRGRGGREVDVHSRTGHYKDNRTSFPAWACVVEAAGISQDWGEGEAESGWWTLIPSSLELRLLCSWASPAGCPPPGLLTEEILMSEPLST